MANVLLVEDFYASIMAIRQVIEGSEQHTFIGYADSIRRTQGFLSKVIAKELEIDVLLLDGNLGDSNPSRSLSHIFPPDESAEPVKRRFRKPLLPQPREVIVYPDTSRSFGADARMIKEFMRICDIDVPTIGMSSESMESNGLTVDYDFGYEYGKFTHPDQGPQLLTAIDRVLN